MILVILVFVVGIVAITRARVTGCLTGARCMERFKGAVQGVQHVLIRLGLC